MVVGACDLSTGDAEAEGSQVHWSAKPVESLGSRFGERSCPTPTGCWQLMVAKEGRVTFLGVVAAIRLVLPQRMATCPHVYRLNSGLLVAKQKIKKEDTMLEGEMEGTRRSWTKAEVDGCGQYILFTV